MKQIPVPLGDGYSVFLESGLLAKAGPLLAAQKKPCQLALISDERVYSLWGSVLSDSLKKAGFSLCCCLIPPGEESKSLAVYEKVLLFLAENSLSRSDLVLALGGGAIGDLAGFAASTYRRGIPFLQIPTTLLSMIDSSLGGKNGINLPGYKNLAGSFYQPLAVLADPQLLKTLPEEALRSGLGEMIKYAVLADPHLFSRLEKAQDIRELAFREDMIADCLTIKTRLMEGDEKDLGQRRMLNLGHSFGHALEVLSGYRLPHGSAVGCGLALVTRASLKKGLCPEEEGLRILHLLKKHAFPLTVPYSAEAMAGAMKSDKKSDGKILPLIVPLAIGHCTILPLSREEVFSWIQDALKE